MGENYLEQMKAAIQNIENRMVEYFRGYFMTPALQTAESQIVTNPTRIGGLSQIINSLFTLYNPHRGCGCEEACDKVRSTGATDISVRD